MEVIGEWVIVKWESLIELGHWPNGVIGEWIFDQMGPLAVGSLVDGVIGGWDAILSDVLHHLRSNCCKALLLKKVALFESQSLTNQ